MKGGSNRHGSCMIASGGNKARRSARAVVVHKGADVITVTGALEPCQEGEKPAPVAKILLVEDNEMNRDMLSRRLQRKGYVVAIAEDGSQGVAMAGKETPDVILLDMSLPVIDGWTAARQLKAGEATRAIPIIALTAHAMSGDREKALEAGCDDYDTKPVEMPRLLGKIEALLEKKPAAS